MGRLAPAIGLLIAIVAVVVVIGVFSAGEGTKSVTDGPLEQFLVSEPVKKITVKTEAGQDVAIDATVSDKTLVTFWDASCPECQAGLPIIASFVAAHPEIKPIYINVKNAPEEAHDALKKLNLDIETYYDPTGTAQAVWSGTMPATYFIRNGSFRVFFPGRPNAEHLNALLTLE